MPRPPIDNPATERVELRMTPDQKRRLDKIVAARQVDSRTEYLLKCAFGPRPPLKKNKKKKSK